MQLVSSEFVRMWNAGDCAGTIAQALGLASKQRVYHLRMVAGLPPRAPYKGRQAQDEADAEYLRRAWLDGVQPARMASRLKVSERTVYNRAAAAGLPARAHPIPAFAARINRASP